MFNAKEPKSRKIGEKLSSFFDPEDQPNNLLLEYARKFPDAGLMATGIEVKGHVITVSFPETVDIASPQRTVEFHITKDATIIAPNKPGNMENAILLGERLPELYGMLFTGVLRANILAEKSEAEAKLSLRSPGPGK